MVTNTEDARLMRSVDAAFKHFNVNNKGCLQELREGGLYGTLTKLTRGSKMMGDSVIEKALVRQWVQYQEYMLYVDKRDLSSLQVLDQGLHDRTYLAGEKITFADFLLFYSLQPLMEELSFQEKEAVLNVSRWFVNLQTFLAVGSTSVLLSRTNLY